MEGVDLKKTSGVDTKFEASHNLALAQRDSGAIEPALTFFLKGTPLETVVEDGPPDESRGGAFYGNIGRSLHLMGQINQALICYRKSAQIIEEEVHSDSLANKGYIRDWVGELMYLKGHKELASAGFSAAVHCWELIAPPKAESIERRFYASEFEGLAPLPRDAAEKRFLSWIQEGK